MRKFDYSIINTLKIRKKSKNIICHKYTRLVIDKTANIQCIGKLNIGIKENKNSKQETRLVWEKIQN